LTPWRAGLPTTVVCGETACSTTLLASTLAPSPIFDIAENLRSCADHHTAAYLCVPVAAHLAGPAQL